MNTVPPGAVSVRVEFSPTKPETVPVTATAL